MTKTIKADICIIGGGSGGLSLAAGASQMGSNVVLFEGHKMGGDCLNYGCVPSKAILAAGKAAHGFTSSEKFGVEPAEPKVDFSAVHQHVRGVIAGIEPHDSVERFEGLGVTVVEEKARFLDENRVQGGDTIVEAKKIVVSTGSSPFVPPIPGLDTVDYLTNEAIFDQTSLPKHLIIIGGGPIGVELAQAHRRLGAEVTVIEMFSIMAKDDPDLVEVVRKSLLADGVNLAEQTKVNSVSGSGASITVHCEANGQPVDITGDGLLVAVGRRPNLDGLDLEKAGIEYTPRGITVDAGLRSSNKRVFAIGDVAGGFQFTHVAGYHASVAIRKLLFKMPAKADHSAVPWVTYTDPELANVGMTKAMAESAGETFQELTFDYAENDRARAERATDGLIKVIVGKKGRILGAGVAGRNAGELILPWALAISNKLKIGAMANVIAPYPTYSELSKRVAGSYYTPTLFSKKTKRLVGFLGRFG